MVVTVQNDFDDPQNTKKYNEWMLNITNPFMDTGVEMIENRIPKRNLHTCLHCIIHNIPEVEIIHQEMNG